MYPTHPYKPASNRRLDADLYARSGQPVFITVRAYLDAAPFRDPDRCKMAVDLLLEEGARSDCRIVAYCLMPDHLHFIASPNRDGVSVLSFTERYKGKTTNQSWKLGWRGKLWQPRFYDHIVRSDERLEQIVEYILRNPERKGLVSPGGAWSWSGAPGIL